MSFVYELIGFVVIFVCGLFLFLADTGKKVFQLAGLLVLSMMSCLKQPDRPGRTSRPNIIFLLSDDQRDNTFGAMGPPGGSEPPGGCHRQCRISRHERFMKH